MEIRRNSLQLRVLGLGIFQDGDVSVGVFPQREKILVRALGLSRVTAQSVRAPKPRCARAPIGSFCTTPRRSMIF